MNRTRVRRKSNATGPTAVTMKCQAPASKLVAEEAGDLHGSHGNKGRQFEDAAIQTGERRHLFHMIESCMIAERVPLGFPF